MDCNRFGYISGEGVYRCVMTSNPKGRLSLDGTKFDISWDRPKAPFMDADARRNTAALMNKMVDESFITGRKFRIRRRESPNLIVATALEGVGVVSSVAEIVSPKELRVYRPEINEKIENVTKDGFYSVILTQSDNGDLVVGNTRYSPVWISHPSGSDAIMGARMVEDALTTTRDFLEENRRLPSSIVAMALEGIGTIYTSAK
jgi:hypothetical protein